MIRRPRRLAIPRTLPAILPLFLPLFLPAPLPLRAQEIPAPVGYVNDFADVISADDEARMASIIDEVRQKSGGEIVVVTMLSLGGRTLDELALRIGREWQVGQKGQPGDSARNTGVVLLVIPKETSPDGSGHLRIELGLGANAFITATEAGRIADNYMVPEFRGGDYGRGILLGVQAIGLQFAERFGFELTGVAEEVERGPAPGGGPSPAFIFFVVLFIILSIA